MQEVLNLELALVVLLLVLQANEFEVSTSNFLLLNVFCSETDIEYKSDWHQSNCCMIQAVLLSGE